ncbi:hypothetical protein BTHE68_41110 [Burkholderia sp. THE68]|nr:hypothetical protein BTHE68_41110 [Burkholderia sp. THE68]
MARRLGALPSMLNAYASGELPTPLHIYLRAAYVTGACLRQILVTQQFDSLQEAHTDTEFVLHRARSKASYKQELVDERLHEAIAGSGEMSVEAIARSLNLEPVTVWRRSGKLARQVAKKHARFVARRSAQKKAKFVEEVRALAKRYKSSGRLATQTDIKHELNDAGCGIDPWKRSVIDAILAETFGFRSPSREGLTGE